MRTTTMTRCVVPRTDCHAYSGYFWSPCRTPMTARSFAASLCHMQLLASFKTCCDLQQESCGIPGRRVACGISHPARLLHVRAYRCTSCLQDDFGDLIANEEAEAAQEEGSHLRSAYQRASRHASATRVKVPRTHTMPLAR